MNDGNRRQLGKGIRTRGLIYQGRGGKNVTGLKYGVLLIRLNASRKKGGTNAAIEEKEE